MKRIRDRTETKNNRKEIKMKFYIITFDNDDGSQSEYFTSLKKAKSRMSHLKKNRDDYCIDTVYDMVFYTHIKPTKKGILRALNSNDGGYPVKEGK